MTAMHHKVLDTNVLIYINCYTAFYLQHSTIKSNHVHVPSWHTLSTINLFSTTQNRDARTMDSCNFRKSLGSYVRPLLAVEPGVEASISDENVVTVKNANILVESQDDDKMQVKVELPGKETQIVFDKVLNNLARTAPPVPGFRRQKGGKTSKTQQQTVLDMDWIGTNVNGIKLVVVCAKDMNALIVPKSFLLSIIGEDRVTKFVIQEIVTSTIADYNDILVKDNKINTIQSAEELQSLFNPGSDFEFNATLELEKQPDTQTTAEDEDSSEPSNS
ncbi:hypothetical protein LXL04_023297 [Taraxacum kok-saghyz]